MTTYDITAHLEGRTIVLELMMRSVLSMLFANTRDPMGLIDRISHEFESSLAVINFAGIEETQADSLRQSLLTIFENNMTAIRLRIVGAAMEEAAQVETRN